MIPLIPKYIYNKHGILVPEVDPEYPSREIEIEVPKRIDSKPNEERNKKSGKKNKKKYKLKR